MLTVKQVFEIHKNIKINFYWRYNCKICKKSFLEYDEEISFEGDEEDFKWYEKNYGGYIPYDTLYDDDILKIENDNEYMFIRDTDDESICDKCEED